MIKIKKLLLAAMKITDSCSDTDDYFLGHYLKKVLIK